MEKCAHLFEVHTAGASAALPHADRAWTSGQYGHERIVPGSQMYSVRVQCLARQWIYVHRQLWLNLRFFYVKVNSILGASMHSSYFSCTFASSPHLELDIISQPLDSRRMAKCAQFMLQMPPATLLPRASHLAVTFWLQRRSIEVVQADPGAEPLTSMLGLLTVRRRCWRPRFKRKHAQKEFVFSRNLPLAVQRRSSSWTSCGHYGLRVRKSDSIEERACVR